MGRGRCLREGRDAAVLSIGTAGNFAAEGRGAPAAEGLEAAHYDLRFVRPLDEELLHAVGRTFRHVTVEDGGPARRRGRTVAAFFNAHGYDTRTVSLGIGDAFCRARHA